MSSGIIMVAFGEQYDELAARTVAYSRKYTSAPIRILTNVVKVSDCWSRIRGVTFQHLGLPQDQNRAVKTRIIDYSPFDVTLYLDCDAIVQRDGISRLLSAIKGYDLTLNVYGRWAARHPLNSCYRKALSALHADLPLTVYYGALVGFTKTDKARAFFSRWHDYWLSTGSGRDMPALAAAVKDSDVAVRELTNKDGYFSWGHNRHAVIQHEYGRYVRCLVGYPGFTPYKPFDKAVPHA